MSWSQAVAGEGRQSPDDDIQAMRRVTIEDVNRVARSYLHFDQAITAILTRAPGNDAPIGGVKVATEHGWFAARPSGTEDVYKVYAESFLGEDHLGRILEEAQDVVTQALAVKG